MIEKLKQALLIPFQKENRSKLIPAFVINIIQIFMLLSPLTLLIFKDLDLKIIISIFAAAALSPFLSIITAGYAIKAGHHISQNPESSKLPEWSSDIAAYGIKFFVIQFLWLFLLDFIPFLIYGAISLLIFVILIKAPLLSVLFLTILYILTFIASILLQIIGVIAFIPSSKIFIKTLSLRKSLNFAEIFSMIKTNFKKIIYTLICSAAIICFYSVILMCSFMIILGLFFWFFLMFLSLLTFSIFIAMTDEKEEDLT